MESLARGLKRSPSDIEKRRTEAGKRATASHTGSLSARIRSNRAAFAQTGAIRAESLTSSSIWRGSLRPNLTRGNRLGIITTSGSLGALSTDVAASSGLTVPPLSHDGEQVRKYAGWMNVKNPRCRSLGIYSQLLPMLLADQEIDMVLAIMVIPYEAVRNFKTAGFRVRIGLAISHPFASNIRISLWLALSSGILNIWMIFLPLWSVRTDFHIT